MCVERHFCVLTVLSVLTRVARVLSLKQRVLTRVMGRYKKPKDNADDWYQKALRDDPDGADELKRKRREAEQARRDQAKARKRLRLLPKLSMHLYRRRRPRLRRRAAGSRGL